ncbi:MAG TPA: hypothetical protein VKG44_01840 [Candidatus Baltobacteraceae bacterium]|nr:hypothetical protein [Candidatus Baltobacteraceae bacterium]
MTAGLFLGAIAMALATLIARGKAVPGAPRAAARPAPPGFLAALLGASIAALFLVQLRTIEIAAQTQVPFPPAYAGLPVVPIDEAAPAYGHTPPWVGNTVFALTLGQSAAMLALYRVLRARRPGRGAALGVALASALMLAGALRTPATTSEDLYLYAGFAHLGAAAYAPPALPFQGEFRALNRLWGTPLLPAAHGPLWIGLSRASLLAGPSLAAQIEAFRVGGALFFCASVGLLLLLRCEPAVVALFALNPALVEQYVADGHNDIVCLALTMGAFLAVRRSPSLAVVLVAAAGAIKLPFALLGSLAFATLAGRRQRLLSAALALLLATGVTLLFSGGRYFVAAARVMQIYVFGDAFSAGARVAAAAVALLAFGAALWARRFNRGASWSFLAFGTELFPWYVAWGIPYAYLEASWFGVYLLSAPLVAFNLTTVYGPTTVTRAAYALLVLTPLLLLVGQRLGTREARNAQRRTPGL